MYDLLITPIDEHNDSTIILIRKFEFKKIYILISEKCRDGLRENLKDEAKFRKAEIEFVSIKDGIEIIDNIVLKYKKPLINLTGGERIQSLQLLKYIMEKNVDGIYIDIVGRKKYIFGQKYEDVNEHLIDLEIEDMLIAGGNEILEDSSKLIKEKYILEIANIILQNIELWHKYKQRLYNNNIFSHYYGDTTKVVIKTSELEKEEVELLEIIIKWLEKRELIKIEKGKEELVVKFLHKFLKGFIFKSGTWLEIITESVVASIESIDQVKSGLVFLWDKNNSDIKNELDVVAIRDSTIIVISCKDSEKYDEAALNELEVYSERIGGEKVKKILVATKEPIKSGIQKRAMEMGIDLVILNKDIDKFKKILEEKINK